MTCVRGKYVVRFQNITVHLATIGVEQANLLLTMETADVKDNPTIPFKMFAQALAARAVSCLS